MIFVPGAVFNPGVVGLSNEMLSDIMASQSLAAIAQHGEYEHLLPCLTPQSQLW